MFGKKNLIKLFAFILFSLPVMHASAKTVVRMLHLETNPDILAVWESIEKDFEAKNPDIEVQLEFIENEAFKAKIPTLLQSNQRPDIFFSWGGGNFQERARSGLLQDITQYAGNLSKNLSAGGMNAFTYEGKIYGAPYYVAQVGFWYNKTLTKKAGVQMDSVSTWDDLLGAVQQIKDAGITPIAVGGGDKWPLHFYWSYLVMRAGGFKTFNDAMNSKGEGFEAKSFVRAGEEFKKLIDLQPFQKGFMASNYLNGSGVFGDHKAALHLMGDWDLNTHRNQSVSKEGVKNEDLGFIQFPSLPGGMGEANDSLGAVNGWAFAKGASPESVKWLEFFLSPDSQKKLAAGGHIIPVAKGAGDSVEDPFRKQIANNIANTNWHQVFFDQALGSDVGSVINDVSAELATGDTTPSEAAERIQEAWEMR